MQTCWILRPKDAAARRRSAALLGGMQATATRQMRFGAEGDSVEVFSDTPRCICNVKKRPPGPRAGIFPPGADGQNRRFLPFSGSMGRRPCTHTADRRKGKSFQHLGPYTSCKRVLIFPQVENTVEKVKNFSLKAPFRCGIQPFQPTFQPFHRKAPAAVGYDLYFSRWKADHFRARNLARFAENADIPLTNVIYC